MARKAPKADTLRLLYTLSGNACAFPHCEHPIFNDKGLYVAQLCHIEAAQKGGPRFNSAQTNDERNGCENLMFMCHRHHKETDDVVEFTVKKLKEIKAIHESQFTEQGRKASNKMIRQVIEETAFFWNTQKQKVFKLRELKIERDFDLTIIQLFDELNAKIKAIRKYCNVCANSDSNEVLQKDFKQLCERLGINIAEFSSVPYYENPFLYRNWEMHNIRRPNLFSHLTLCMAQLRIKVLEELLSYKPTDKEINQVLAKARKEFNANFNKSYYAD